MKSPCDHIPNKIAVESTGSPILFVATSVIVDGKGLCVTTQGFSYGGVAWPLDLLEIKGKPDCFGGPWLKLSKYIKDKRFWGDDGKRYRIQIVMICSDHCSGYVYEFAKHFGSGAFAAKTHAHLAGDNTYRFFSPSQREHLGFNNALHVNIGKMEQRAEAMLVYHGSKTGKFKLSLKAYALNLVALELAAEYWCKEHLGLSVLDWTAFWELAKSGEFYKEKAP